MGFKIFDLVKDRAVENKVISGESRVARALMVSLKSLVSGMSVSFLFSAFVVVQKCLDLLDIFGLALLHAPA